MDQTTAMMLGSVPSILIIAAALIIRHTVPGEASRRWLVYFYEGTALFLLLLTYLVRLVPPPLHYQLFSVPAILTPPVAGLSVLILLNLPAVLRFPLPHRLVAPLLALAAAAALVLLIGFEPYAWMEILPGGLVLLLAGILIDTRRTGWLWPVWLLVMAVWGGMNTTEFARDFRPPEGLQVVIGVILMAVPVFSVVVAALLLHTGSQMALLRADDGVAPSRGRQIEGAARAFAAVILVGYIAYTTFWASVWDQTTDGLGGVFFMMMVGPAAAACGMLMSLKTKGSLRLVGIGFLTIAPILVYFSFTYGWQVKFPAMTEQRAERIKLALDRFYRREDRYPKKLDELVPYDLLYVPGPVMFRGEGWCYQASASAYELAAFYHEYFGLPVSLKVYSSRGELDPQANPCSPRLKDMQDRFDWTRGALSEPPAPTPGPTSNEELPVSREMLQPLYTSARRLFPGEWSPGGAWWLFREVSQDGKSASLLFYQASSGHICRQGQVVPFDLFVTRSLAWLPGERVLVMIEGGRLARLEPCGAVMEEMALPGGEAIKGINAVDKTSGRALLQSAGEYYLLQPGSLAFTRVVGVQPPGMDVHWDQFAWAPGGSRVAISHLNGRTPGDGSTLFLVDGSTGQVAFSQKVDMASEQSAPMVEWMNAETLILHGPERALRLDLRASPPAQAEVMKDLLGLDLSEPDEVHASFTLASAGGGYHVGIRANHPRSQAIYVYHSETGQVSTLDPEDQALLIFADGQFVDLTKNDPAGQAQDLYELFWVDDASRQPVTVKAAGHSPRDYPLLNVMYLPASSKLLLASSNGVSLVDIPSGSLLNFWRTGSGVDPSPRLTASPDGKTVLLFASGDGIYKIPIEPWIK